MLNKDQLKQKESLDNSLSKNKYCFCKNYGEVGKCLICKSIKEGQDYQKINSDGANKYAVAITGTNGKTTLTNIIGLVLNNVYKKVGYASTTGIFKEKTKISDLEHRASEHYVYLLNQPDLDIVISEQPEAGIYKYGLPRDHDFGIVINMSEDHLERYWINSGMDDLYAIKSLVAKMAIEGCITSVDYYWTRKLIEDFDRGHFFLFGRNQTEVRKYLGKGYQIITEQNGEIVILKKEEKIVVGKTNDFLLTLNGILEYNIENILAIISLFYNSSKFSKDFETLVSELKKIPPSFELNPARFNVLNYKDNIVVFDYAHNVDGYSYAMKSLTKLKENLSKKELIGLVAVAGDRTEEVIDQLAKLFTESFDQVFVRQVADNKNIKLLSEKLMKKNGQIWEKGYEEFIKDFSQGNNIIYITIAGHGHVDDLRKTIKNLKIKDIQLGLIK